MNGNVCFVADNPGGAKALCPVINRMMLEKSARITVVGHRTAKKVFADASIGFNAIEELGVRDISCSSMQSVFGGVKPDLVVAGTAAQEGKPIDVIEQTAILAARNLGIPCISVMDSWQSYVACFTDIRTGKLDCLPSRIVVMDDIAKKEAVEAGLPEGILVPLGNPHYDSLAAKAAAFSEDSRQVLRRALGLNCQTLFFFAPNVFSFFKPEAGFWTLDTINIILAALAQLPDVGLVVQLHTAIDDRSPGDKEKLTLAISMFENRRVALVSGFASLDLALAADAVMVESSNMGLEATYMRRPVISLQPGLKTRDDLFVSRAGVIPVGYTPEGCARLLKKAADPRYRAEILDQSAGFATDGKATDRLVELIYSL